MTPTPSGKRKMILDVDTGIDDALPTLPYTTRLTYWNGWGSGTFR